MCWEVHYTIQVCVHTPEICVFILYCSKYMFRYSSPVLHSEVM